MKPIYILLLVAVILLTGCQSAAPEPSPEVVEEVEQPVEEGYPPPDQMPSEGPDLDPVSDEPYPYLEAPPVSNEPYPALQVPMVSNDPYAAPSNERASITWEETKALILEGQVVQVTQLHSLDVTIYLKDGRIVSTVEPEIDAIFILLDECGEICSEVVRATE